MVPPKVLPPPVAPLAEPFAQPPAPVLPVARPNGSAPCLTANSAAGRGVDDAVTMSPALSGRTSTDLVAPNSFSDIRAVHQATTEQLRARRTEPDGRAVVIACAVVVLGGTAVVLGSLFF